MIVGELAPTMNMLIWSISAGMSGGVLWIACRDHLTKQYSALTISHIMCNPGMMIGFVMGFTRAYTGVPLFHLLL
jgi:hypothetical protein